MNDQAMPVITAFKDGAGHQGFSMWCPGCQERHTVYTSGPGPVWQFNGDMAKPTFSPSVRVRWNENGAPKVCHSWIRDGVWHFLSDCTHALAGKEVPMESLHD